MTTNLYGIQCNSLADGDLLCVRETYGKFTQPTGHLDDCSCTI